MIDNKTKEDFWIRLYFNPENFSSDAIRMSAIKRAYRDFSRTFYIDKINPINIKNRPTMVVNSSIELTKLLTFFLENKLNSLEEFDNHHKRIALEFKSKWSELTFGQIQKWMNMTLKYWLLLGEGHVKGIDLNSAYFHVPIDNIVLKEMLKIKNPPTWSRFETYESYMEFQHILRSLFGKDNLIEKEFIFFNRTESFQA